MNKKFIDYEEYKILQFMGSGDGISSLKHKLDCRIASSNAMVSHLKGINRLSQITAERIAHVLAVTYIPFGKRGKEYVSKILVNYNKTLEDNAKEHALYIVRYDNICDNDIKHIILGTCNNVLDLNNIPIPTYEILPFIMFELEEMLDELNRANLWPEDPKLATRNNIMQYICANMERENKIILPKQLVEKIMSKEFLDFTQSNLTKKEQKYLDEYLEKVNYFSK